MGRITKVGVSENKTFVSHALGSRNLSSRRSGFLDKETEDERERDSVKQRLETSLVMFQCKIDIVFRHRKKARAKNRTEQCAQSEVEKIDHASCRPTEFWRIRFLNDGVRNHRSARRDPHQDSNRVTAKNFRVTE